MSHIVLLGDSVFDNATYTGGDPDVVSHLRTILPRGWRATLCAVDGATTRTLRSQLARVPADATHAVVSIGGNDALQHTDLLSFAPASALQVFAAFDGRLQAFETAYRSAILSVTRMCTATTLCTIYNGALEPARATAARLGVALFNDVILRTALDLRVDVLELRTVCTDSADYANPIEPSGRGGLKIARGIAGVTGAVDGAALRAGVWRLASH